MMNRDYDYYIPHAKWRVLKGIDTNNGTFKDDWLKMIGVDRFKVKSGFDLDKITVKSGFSLDRFLCKNCLLPSGIPHSVRFLLIINVTLLLPSET